MPLLLIYMVTKNNLSERGFSSRVFWTDWNRDGPRIESSSMDGTNRMTIVDNFVGMPNSLLIDFERYQLCWTDGGSQKRFDRQEIEPKIGT